MFIAVILLFIVIIVVFFSTKLDKEETKFITSSMLTDTINISELSTAEFIYNGIAQVYEDDEKEKVKCNIKYYAIVKAGVDMNDVEFEIDNDSKIIKSKLPEIKITSNITDTEQVDFIPSNPNISLQEAIIVCKKDAEKEANKQTKLKETAKENLKDNVEGLLMPIINKQGYTLIWE